MDVWEYGKRLADSRVFLWKQEGGNILDNVQQSAG